MLRSFSAVAVAALGLMLAASAAQTSTVAGIVLGSKTSFEPYGHGWGTAHPVAVDDGGDPTGRAWKLRWTNWGNGTSIAHGFTYLMPTLKQN